MAIQHLVLDTFEENDYELIAIHSSLPSYRLAFLLNKNLNLRLYRKSKDICFKFPDLTANFPLYQYYDSFLYNEYNLIGNKFETNSSASEGLFSTSDDFYITKHLIPELKKVDFFLKIESETSSFSSKLLITKLLITPQIITAYTVEHTKLKSKNNLIFE